MSRWLTAAWFRGHPALWLLWPSSVLFAALAALRRAYYCLPGRAWRAPVPVVVVGNITVGGSGKTPLVIALVEALRAAGLRPGVVSRGYGGRAAYPARVTADSPAGAVGDEPLLIQRRTGVPVVVDPLRVRGVQYLLAETDCNVVLLDDGLQHYALARDLELVVVDGDRGFGNGRRLPMGPLREPVRRLRSVAWVIQNGGEPSCWPDAVAMSLQPGALVPLAAAVGAAPARHEPVVAIAGIGHPERFFATLAGQGWAVEPQPFPDHHAFVAEDFYPWLDRTVVMTEKDAVKCADIAPPRSWFLPVTAVLPSAFLQDFVARVQALSARRSH